LEQIERVAEALRGRAVVVVDEAYGEFSPLASAVTLRARFPHLVVLRTLSKAYALAGARIGTLIGDPALVRVLRAIMAPYPLSQVCAQAALNALSPDGLRKARAHIDTLLAERSRLSAAIAKLSKVKRVYPSDANFLVVAFADAASVYRETLARGIVLRDVSKHAALPDCLRISVGTPEENDRLLACLESLA
jgi:histidinol-phosphate aminotransferase